MNSEKDRFEGKQITGGYVYESKVGIIHVYTRIYTYVHMLLTYYAATPLVPTPFRPSPTACRDVARWGRRGAIRRDVAEVLRLGHMLYYTILYHTVQYYTLLYSTLLHYTILYSNHTPYYTIPYYTNLHPLIINPP